MRAKRPRFACLRSGQICPDGGSRKVPHLHRFGDGEYNIRASLVLGSNTTKGDGSQVMKRPAALLRTGTAGLVVSTATAVLAAGQSRRPTSV